MLLARIKDGEVHNVTVHKDCDISEVAPKEGFEFVDITSLVPRPGKGWGYVDGEFTLPPGPTELEMWEDELAEVEAMFPEWAEDIILLAEGKKTLNQLPKLKGLFDKKSEVRDRKPIGD